jgi:ABC-2 type transport system ATP-binding protein
MTVPSQSAVSVHGLEKRYRRGEPPAVAELALRIEPGEIFGFVGPNGAGKTTTIRMLLGLVRPDRGGGAIFGHDIVADSVAVRRRVGYMSGEVRLYNAMRGEELLDLVELLHGGDRVLRRELCARFDVPLERRIKTYSAGQKQQLALIVALAHPAGLLILDEPTKGLDPSKKREFLEIIAERGRGGAAVIISSHVLSEIESICSRVGFIRAGRLVADEELAAVQTRLRGVAAVAFSEDVDPASLGLPGVRAIERRGAEYLLRLDGDPAALLHRLADLPLKSLRYGRATLDDVYDQLYSGAGKGVGR